MFLAELPPLSYASFFLKTGCPHSTYVPAVKARGRSFRSRQTRLKVQLKDDGLSVALAGAQEVHLSLARYHASTLPSLCSGPYIFRSFATSMGFVWADCFSALFALLLLFFLAIVALQHTAVRISHHGLRRLLRLFTGTAPLGAPQRRGSLAGSPCVSALLVCGTGVAIAYLHIFVTAQLWSEESLHFHMDHWVPWSNASVLLAETAFALLLIFVSRSQAKLVFLGGLAVIVGFVFVLQYRPDLQARNVPYDKATITWSEGEILTRVHVRVDRGHSHTLELQRQGDLADARIVLVSSRVVPAHVNHETVLRVGPRTSASLTTPFYTDNGWTASRRAYNFFKLLPASYFPAVRFVSTDVLDVLLQQSLGVTSFLGTLELMIHRRVQGNDERGLSRWDMDDSEVSEVMTAFRVDAPFLRTKENTEERYGKTRSFAADANQPILVAVFPNRGPPPVPHDFQWSGLPRGIRLASMRPLRRLQREWSADMVLTFQHDFVEQSDAAHKSCLSLARLRRILVDLFPEKEIACKNFSHPSSEEVDGEEGEGERAERRREEEVEEGKEHDGKGGVERHVECLPLSSILSCTLRTPPGER